MIGHFLLTLAPEEEDRVLTRPMMRGGRLSAGRVGCLVEVAWWETNDLLADFPLNHANTWTYTAERSVPRRYDELCERFGEARVNGVIRMRILMNRAARLLPREVPV